MATSGKSRPKQTKHVTGGTVRRVIGGVILFPVMLVCTYLGFCALLLALYNVIPPPITGVQIQRLVEGVSGEEAFRFRYRPVGLSKISDDLEHAVVAAEDARFYDHNGVDWKAVEQAVKDNRRRRRMRGGSTITQQLVKNLFMTTHSSWIRKGLEVPLAYAAEVLLPKQRILYLYLNVIEWGRGVYGAEAASRYYYEKSAAALTRRQAAGLAAVVPAPRTRSPERMGGYASTIMTRMRQMGW